ncbi:MAG: hypothetical protein ABIJ86_09745 [Spirochaetota bacterium]
MNAGKRGKAGPKEEHYYRLDNSAIFTAAIAGAAGPLVYRFSFELDQTLQLPRLEAAIAHLVPRFPYLFVELRNGVFWHYLEPAANPPRVQAEAHWPVAPLPYRRGRPLCRITAYGRRVACEFHHAVTDGTGALAFLRSLIVEYLMIGGLGTDLPRKFFGDVIRPEDPIDPEEEEDAYGRYFNKSSPNPVKTDKAFLMPGRRRTIEYRETEGNIPLRVSLDTAKSLKVTLTEFLASVHIAALQDLYEALPPRRRWSARKNIAVQIPVNLRNLYPSRTLRNFFLCVSPAIDMRLGHWSFEEILRRVHHGFRLGLEEKEMLRQIRRNVGGERNPIGRAMFLPLKTILLRVINKNIGLKAFSGSISNVGTISLPEPFASHICGFGLILPRGRHYGASIGVFSWKETLTIIIGSCVANRDFERAFFARLAGLGLPVTVRCNEPYTPIKAFQHQRGVNS